ncbi:hypothetical protein [Streptomyces sp. ID05-47C]|nr:hypothetical protein [Streptomyces sp. ID05-47C]MDX3573174.1 hypothetical protein [Streptomyces sp. ID05-47C]
MVVGALEGVGGHHVEAVPVQELVPGRGVLGRAAARGRPGRVPEVGVPSV